MRGQPPLDDSILTLSDEDIQTIVSWHEDLYPRLSPILSPIGTRILTKKDVEQVVKAWREKNGQPELPVGDFWQYDGKWRQGPNLAGLDFSDKNLRDLDLNGIIFSHANLQKARFNNGSLVGAWLARANMQRTRFVKADLTRANFFETDLTEAEFWLAKLSKASFRGAILERTRLLDVDLDGAYFHRARLSNTEMYASQLGGSIGEERDRKYDRAIEAYARLKANFESIGRYADAGWAYRKERRMRKSLFGQRIIENWRSRRYWQAIKEFFKWTSNWFVEILCDYGESVWRVIAWMVGLLFVIGPMLLSIFGGLEWTGTNREIYVNMSTNWQKWIYTYLQYLLYMFDTFTTASFSELAPHNDAVRLISGLLAMTGIFLTGLLGFVAGNRIRNA